MDNDATVTTTPTESQDTTDYKRQYEAALRAGDKATRAHENVMSQLSSEKQAHETAKATIENLKTEITSLTSSLTQKESNLSELQGKVSGLEVFQSKATRLELIINEYPNLFQFEKDGLLPQGNNPEELRTSFTKFSEKLNAVSKAIEADHIAGGKPSNIPAPEEPKSSVDMAQDYLQKAVQAQRSGNMSEYESFFSKFLQEKNKQTA